jgi:hypothetical protein
MPPPPVNLCPIHRHNLNCTTQLRHFATETSLVHWHIATLRGNAAFGRFRSEADIDQAALGKPPAAMASAPGAMRSGARASPEVTARAPWLGRGCFLIRGHSRLVHVSPPKRRGTGPGLRPSRRFETRPDAHGRVRHLHHATWAFATAITRRRIACGLALGLLSTSTSPSLCARMTSASSMSVHQLILIGFGRKVRCVLVRSLE